MNLKEAREKFCPFIFIADKDRQNSSSSYKPNVCRGNTCMMWRWFNKDANEGYCGLAGIEITEK